MACKKIFGDKNHQEIQCTCIREISSPARKFNAENNIQLLLDFLLFSISRNFTIVQLAVSVFWLFALLLISDIINLDICCAFISLKIDLDFYRYFCPEIEEQT